MLKAHLLTIGTEITAGEVVNSNAAWVSLQLEALGVRVFSHLTVRDQREEVLKALEWLKDSDILIVTGGLGPTSDDITREVVASWCHVPLEFDEKIWNELNLSYQRRGLTVREAHRHQCHFPVGSDRLANPVGTAYGFAIRNGHQHVFVLPGPPSELEGMWTKEVARRLKPILTNESRVWVRWTCIGVPESEVAELVEPIIENRGIEVGYRAQIPYVKVKVFVDPAQDQKTVDDIEKALASFIVARDQTDLADELLHLWPTDVLTIEDSVTGGKLAQRLFESQRQTRFERPRLRVRSGFESSSEPEGLFLLAQGEELSVQVKTEGVAFIEKLTLPYKTKLLSERGRRSAAEWAIWLTVRALRARSSHSST